MRCPIQWIRFATEAETSEAETWWRVSEVQPQSLAHDGSSYPASQDDPMGLYGDHMLALEQSVNIQFAEKPCAFVDDIHTPDNTSSDEPG